MQSTKKRVLSFVLTMVIALSVFFAFPFTVHAAVPTLSNVSITALFITGANVQFDVDEASTVYYLCLLASDPAPADATALKAVAAGSYSFPAGTGISFGMPGLSSNTTYTAYLVAENIDGDSNMASVTFTTLDLISNLAVTGLSDTQVTYVYDLAMTSDIYLLRQLASAPAPTMADVMATAVPVTVTAGTGLVWNDTTLSPNTDYTVYIVAFTSPSENQMLSVSFTTLAAATPPAPPAPPATPGSPHTGDNSNMSFWTITSIVSLSLLLCLAVVVASYRKKRAK